jgi:hypothetical protein
MMPPFPPAAPFGPEGPGGGDIPGMPLFADAVTKAQLEKPTPSGLSTETATELPSGQLTPALNSSAYVQSGPTTWYSAGEVRLKTDLTPGCAIHVTVEPRLVEHHQPVEESQRRQRLPTRPPCRPVEQGRIVLEERDLTERCGRRLGKAWCLRRRQRGMARPVGQAAALEVDDDASRVGVANSVRRELGAVATDHRLHLLQPSVGIVKPTGLGEQVGAEADVDGDFEVIAAVDDRLGMGDERRKVGAVGGQHCSSPGEPPPRPPIARGEHALDLGADGRHVDPGPTTR